MRRGKKFLVAASITTASLVPLVSTSQPVSAHMTCANMLHGHPSALLGGQTKWAQDSIPTTTGTQGMARVSLYIKGVFSARTRSAVATSQEDKGYRGHNACRMGLQDGQMTKPESVTRPADKFWST